MHSPSAQVTPLLHHHSHTYRMVGVNYKKATYTERNLFALSKTQQDILLSLSKEHSVDDVFILSTCNRTEIYGICSHHQILLSLLFQVLEPIHQPTFEQLSYTLNGQDALRHLFEVTSGLDAQILGDYEVVGQVKEAYHRARTHQTLSAFGDRVINMALQASKEVRTHTRISGGTLSASFAAVRCIATEYPDYIHKKILLIGLGTIGTNVYKHLCDYLKVKALTLINRSPIAVENFPETEILPWTELFSAINKADIIITATAAPQPIILAQHFTDAQPRLLIDLSVPNNIAPELNTLPFITLKNTDTIAPLLNEALHKRKQEIPKAKAIINTLLEELINWIHERKQMAMLKDIKSRLLALESLKPTAESNVCPHQQAQKHINQLALQFRKKDLVGCSIITTYQQFLHETNIDKSSDKFVQNASDN